MHERQNDFTYVDQMIKDRTMRGNINPCDFSDLYLLVMHYWRVYWQDDSPKGVSLLQLADEIEYLYNRLYPSLPSIELNRNTRNAGRRKKYGADFVEEIIRRIQNGQGPTEISAVMGCSKSFVSKLNRKQRSRQRQER